MAVFQINRKAVILFLIFLFLGIFLSFAAHAPKFLYYLSFFRSRGFQITIKIAIVLAFCLLIFRWFTKRVLPQNALKLVYGVIFLPLILLPVFRCYFKVPYVFCRACPNKCPWGISRAFILSAFFALNLSGKFWCFFLCPLGTFQESQAQISKQNIKLSFHSGWLAYLVLIIVAWMYFLALAGPHVVSYFFAGQYDWMKITVGIAILILAIAFFIPRFWCRYFCPVSTIADLVLDLRSYLYKIFFKSKQ
ncbi:MAG: 4Fe-4S binding protein [Candidatus Omnitrophota bacterium]